MTAAEIQTSILQGRFTEHELQDINSTIVSILKADRKAKVAKAKAKFKVGDKVKFQHMTGTIKKINRTKCVVDTGGLRSWSVPMTMLRAA